MFVGINSTFIENEIQKYLFTEVFTPLRQYFVEAPLAAITAVSLSG